jgi:predicted FMN-binding regulatory protein PaiB
MGDSLAEFIAGMVKNIVGLEIVLTLSAVGKKLSQNK